MNLQSRPLSHVCRAFLAAIMVMMIGMAALPPAAAAPITPKAAHIRVLTARRMQTSWFAPTFLAQASPAQVQQARDSVIAALGAYNAATADGNGTFVVHFQHGTANAQIQLDNAGRIDGLVFTDVQSAHAHPPRTKLTPQAALDRLLSSPVPLSEWFAPTFLTQVSIALLQQTIAGLSDSLGPYLSVAVKPDGTFQAHYGLGVLNGTVHLDQQGSH